MLPTVTTEGVLSSHSLHPLWVISGKLSGLIPSPSVVFQPSQILIGQRHSHLACSF